MSTLKVNNVQDLGADPVVSNGVIVKGALPSGSVLQVVSVTKSAAQTGSVVAGGTLAISDLTATITPSSASSKILVMVDLSVGTQSSNGVAVIVTRGGSSISVGDASGSRTRVTAAGQSYAYGAAAVNTSVVLLDSPATTSAVSYAASILNLSDSTVTLYVNRSETDSDSAARARSASRITVMEIAG